MRNTPKPVRGIYRRKVALSRETALEDIRKAMLRELDYSGIRIS
jgi:hypothetical protein